MESNQDIQIQREFRDYTHRSAHLKQPRSLSDVFVSTASRGVHIEYNELTFKCWTWRRRL